MKILYYGLDNMEHLGGIETFIINSIRNLNLKNYQVDFMSFNGETPCFYEELKEYGCRFHFVRKRKENYLGNRKDIKELLSNNKYDIVHCHMNSLSYSTVILIASKMGIPVIVHSHNSGNLQGIVSQMLHRLNSYRLLHKNVYRVAVSKEAGDWMFGRDSDYKIIKNGIDTSRFSYDSDKRINIRKELKIPDEAKVICHVGAFRKQKNHERIIEIFEDYLKKEQEAYLLLVGTGDLLSSIKEKVRADGVKEDRIKFLGVRNDVESILSGSDIFLFPSYYEGLPFSMVEAECSGLQCVISDVISDEAYIKELCYPISLNSCNEIWVETLIKCVSNKKNRSNFMHKIDDIGYSVCNQVQQLMSLYDRIYLSNQKG